MSTRKRKTKTRSSPSREKNGQKAAQDGARWSNSAAYLVRNLDTGDSFHVSEVTDQFSLTTLSELEAQMYVLCCPKLAVGAPLCACRASLLLMLKHSLGLWFVVCQ